MSVDVVIPTTRPDGLARLRVALTGFPGRVVIVDGRRIGPAAARNRGWRDSRADWVCFLDDDVVPTDGWIRALMDDLDALPPDVAASQGRIVVPLPAGRPPTDWERNVHGLERAAWATADMAYRRAVLQRVGGFDERFERAYREDSDLALRVLGAGHRLVRGRRTVTHPVGPARPWVSVLRQRGNADDALMRRRHGRGWRDRADAPRGAFRGHLATTVAATAALAALAAGRPGRAAVPAAAWLGLTARFAARRIAPGPRTPGEVAAMVLTSVAIPPVAVAWRVVGEWRHRGVASAGRDGAPAARPGWVPAWAGARRTPARTGPVRV